MTVELFNELLKNIRQKECFEQIYTEYYPQLIKISMSLYGNINDAEDIAQEIFAYLISHEVKTYVENPNALFYALCKYNGQKLFNKEVPINENIDYSTPDNQFISFNMRTALSKLSKEEADIIILFWFCGYSLDEIAKTLRKSYAAVAKQHERAKEKLKKFLSD